MIADLIRWSIHNRFFVFLGTAIFVVWGAYAIRSTPIDALPDLSDAQVIIKTSYPGQAPQVVEDQVTYPLTTAMLAVPQAVTVRGYSFFGDSYVYVIFKEGTDLYWARSRVLEYLSQASGSLPSDAKPALGPDATGVGWIFEYALVDRTNRHDLAELRSLQDWFLKFELQAVPGVAEVATVGGMVRQYQVVIDPTKLQAYRIPLGAVKQAIIRGNGETGGSVIEIAEAEYMVRASGYLKGRSDLQQIPLGTTPDGIALMLGDVASIELGPQMRRGVAELDGEGEVVGGIIVMRFGENASRTIELVKEKLQSLSRSLPDGVEIVTTYDRAELIDESVNTLTEKLIEEFIVVGLVCAVFLFHLSSSAVVVLSLPVGFFAAFIVMQLQGVNANIMSLGGIAIAIGAMVDASIVMIENVHKHIERRGITRENRWTIITDAAVEVGPALFVSLLIITLSFLPVFTLEAQEGRLFTPLALTKTYAMAAAALLSVTLVPVLMGIFIRGNIVAEQRNPLNRFLKRAYDPIIRWVLRAPWGVVALAFAILVIGILPGSRIGSEFMPPLDEGDLMYMPTTHPGISIDKARELLQQTDKIIGSFPEVERVFGKVGRAETATDPAPLTMIETVIKLRPRSEWRPGVTTETLRAEMDRAIQFPGLTNAWVMPIKTRIDMLATGIKTPLGIKIAGPDLAVIETIGKRLEDILRPVSGTQSVYSERVVGGRYLDIDIDRVGAARYGLNILDVQEIVKTAIGGMTVTQTVEGLERYPVNLRYPQRVRDSLTDLELLPIVTPAGAHITLGDVADIRFNDGPGMIKSENARLNGWVYVDIAERDLGSYVAEAKQKVTRELDLPAGYSIAWSGQYEFMERAKERLLLVGPLTIVIIAVLLFIYFRRIGDVILILGTLPMALVGGVTLLYALGYQYSVAVGVGFIALAGVAVEIGVVMLVYLNQALEHHTRLAKDQGRPLRPRDLRQAIVDGALKRVRPIMMTVSAIIAGLLPIMFGGGSGSEVMQRIAAPMIGGMVSATLLALLVIPAIFLIWKRLLLRRA